MMISLVHGNDPKLKRTVPDRLYGKNQLDYMQNSLATIKWKTLTMIYIFFKSPNVFIILNVHMQVATNCQ